jgi:hypothetical protein
MDQNLAQITYKVTRRLRNRRDSRTPLAFLQITLQDAADEFERQMVTQNLNRALYAEKMQVFEAEKLAKSADR